jgi:hypothetical protein
MRVRRISLSIVLVTALTVLTDGWSTAVWAADWVTPSALGDVVVSFDGVVRVYGNADGLLKEDNISVTGSTSTRRIAFDGSLTLFVTDFGDSQLVKLGASGSHPSVGTVSTQANPQSIVFAGDGTYYVASRVGSTQALIRRFDSSGTPTGDFTVTVASSGTCIGMDLDANQKTLYIVDGAINPQPRVIRTLDVSTNSQGPSLTLTGNGGSACGIRALPPVRHSWSSLTTGPTNGGFLVADKDRIQRISSTGAQVATYTTGTSSPSDNNWNDVELDPNTFDFWGLDAGELHVAKFRIAAPSNALLSTNLPAIPRGLTLNGALRAAQTIRLLTNIISDNATFLQDASGFLHIFQIRLPALGSLAVQAVEATSDGNGGGDIPTPATSNEGVCPISLDVDCRLDYLFDIGALPTDTFTAKAVSYSRKRAVFYILTELLNPNSTDPVQIGVAHFDVGTNPTTGSACVPNGATQPAFALLRDPFPHTTSSSLGYSVFPEDITLLVYSDELTTVGRTRNHYVVVSRTDALYNANMVKPDAISSQQLGSTLQIAVEVRDPATNCSVVPGLAGTLVLSIADLTTGRLVVTSATDIFTDGVPPITSGLEFVSNAGQYRSNVTLSPPASPDGPGFIAGHTYRVCVNAKAWFQLDPNARVIGDVCNNQLLVVAGKGKTK